MKKENELQASSNKQQQQQQQQQQHSSRSGCSTKPLPTQAVKHLLQNPLLT